jgi:hypothetical protein
MSPRQIGTRPAAPRLKALAASLSIALAGGSGASADPGHAQQTSGPARNSSLTAARAPETKVISRMSDSGAGSLREALDSAVDGDVVDLRNLHGSIALSGALEPAARVTILGPGRNALTLDGQGQGRVLSTHHSLALSNITIAHGTILRGTADNPVSGGCIRSLGDLTLTNATVSDCHAGAGAGSGNAAGGAIAAASLTMVSSTISNSSANGGSAAQGGGFFADYFATLSDSVVSGNTASAADPGGNAAGGGGYSYGGLSLTNSSVSGNGVSATANAAGGGIYARQGTFYSVGGVQNVNVTNSTISGNSAVGGVLGTGGGMGNGVAQYDVYALAVTSSTIAFNTASTRGGGIFVNPTSPFAAFSSIIAKNSASGDATTADIAAATPVTIGGDHNLIELAGANIATPIGTLTSDPMLAPLANNGGPTLTHALSVGSPAIDAGSNPLALPTDQRGAGFRRVSGPAADIGAFETPDTIFVDGFEPPI